MLSIMLPQRQRHYATDLPLPLKCGVNFELLRLHSLANFPICQAQMLRQYELLDPQEVRFIS